jgi:hypothetical protein
MCNKSQGFYGLNSTLSPAALATWNAFLEHSEWEVTPVELNGVAAALRAAADQVVPENRFGPPENVAAAQREITRRGILAIAAELEGFN